MGIGNVCSFIDVVLLDIDKQNIETCITIAVSYTHLFNKFNTKKTITDGRYKITKIIMGKTRTVLKKSEL